jgi:Xaa-Pro aminopeptidase
MRTVHPSIIIGSYTWDQDRLPRDEFQIRMAGLHRVMDESGWKAMLIYGDAAEHTDLAYFTNFIPRLRWGMGLIPREGEPRVLASMSPRDVPAMKLMTWIPDLLSGWNWEAGFDPWLARLNAQEPIDIGSVRFDLMRPPLMHSLEKSLGNRFRLHAADAAVAACRSPRPRELSTIRQASKVVETAAAAFLQAWRDGHDVETAALAGERGARLQAAQDVRTLVSFDGGRTLAPCRGTFDTKSDPLVGYIAVKHMGYWADIFVSAASAPSELQPRVEAALEAMLQAAGSGVPAVDLHAKALAELGSIALHPVLDGSVGHRIGLSSDEGGPLRADSKHSLAAGEVYTLQIGAHDLTKGGAIVSAMVAITATGAETLCCSPALRS